MTELNVGVERIADGVSVVLEALLMIVCTWTGVVQVGQRQRPEEDSGKQLPRVFLWVVSPRLSQLFFVRSVFLLTSPQSAISQRLMRRAKPGVTAGLISKAYVDPSNCQEDGGTLMTDFLNAQTSLINAPFK